MMFFAFINIFSSQAGEDLQDTIVDEIGVNMDNITNSTDILTLYVQVCGIIFLPSTDNINLSSSFHRCGLGQQMSWVGGVNTRPYQ